MKILPLCIILSLGVSISVYGAGWKKYGPEYNGAGNLPQGDCLEMACPNGCVEDDSNNGECCPAGNLGDNCYGGICGCADQMICQNDKCTCKAGSTEYKKFDGTLGCCNNSDSIRLTISGGEVCCLKTLSHWDEENSKCVECLTKEDCKTKGFDLICRSDKTCGCAEGYVENIRKDGKIACCPADKKYWDEASKKCVECLKDENCSGEKICLTGKVCGCAVGKEEYTKPNGSIGCCNTKKETILTVSKGQVCCANATPYWDEKTSKCVECLTTSDCKDKGTGLECLSNKTCGCNRGYQLNTKKNGKTVCCPDATPHWDESSKSCVECTQDSHCANRSDGKLFCDLKEHVCIKDPCAKYGSACPANGICDCCPVNRSRCNLTGCKNGYVRSGETCVPNPCSGYPLGGCPANATCSSCLSGNSWRYKSTGCRSGYSMSYNGSCRDQCEGYPQTSCGFCEECARCPYNSNRYKKTGCSWRGNCCTKNGACVHCDQVWHIQ